jgi:hypothetical protein
MVTNTVTVSGGGENNTANDTATDHTTILVPVTVTTSPPGLGFKVDNVSYTGSQQFKWTLSSAHIIFTDVSQTAPGSMYTFLNWTDGSTTITVASFNAMANAPVTYTANFSTQYQLTTSVSPAGFGSVTPGPGGFYPAGTVVTLTATPASGHSFTKWTGPVAKTNSATTTVTMSQPQSVTATFK